MGPEPCWCPLESSDSLGSRPRRERERLPEVGLAATLSGGPCAAVPPRLYANLVSALTRGTGRFPAGRPGPASYVWPSAGVAPGRRSSPASALCCPASDTDFTANPLVPNSFCLKTHFTLFLKNERMNEFFKNRGLIDTLS